ncbi:MAG: prolipoprotein diacylglyceryl transferase [Rhodospirillales bacterium]|nr:prolipoprotein diacylglyceryl transferase [Rhodospirillales bacterium]
MVTHGRECNRRRLPLPCGRAYKAKPLNAKRRLRPMLALPFPNIDPVAFEIGPLVVRWYALAYIVGLIIGWKYAVWLNRRPAGLVPQAALDDFLAWAVIGIVLGGRIGYVLFYQPDYFLENPLAVFELWRGGMSFHGGLIGIILAMLLFARKRGVPFLAMTDLVAAAGPIGLFLGRLANFINGELFGRPTDVPWAIIFPAGGPVPRHPSQLYEAALEGVVLFLILLVLATTFQARRWPGVISGTFLAGYGVARIIVEFFREPDPQLGFLWGGATMGQILSLPMVAVGIAVIFYARRRKPA